MTLEINSINYECLHEQKPTLFTKLLYETPAEGVTFIVASLAVRIFCNSFTYPLLGIGISLITTTLVLKSMECYHNQLLTNITEETCKLSKKYPKIQMIACICALAISLVSNTFSFFIGALLGGFGSLILDVEKYKLIREANRSKPK